MAKIRDADSKGKVVSKKVENRAYDEKANISRMDNESEEPRIFGLFDYMWKSREISVNGRGQRTTDLSSEIAGDLSSRNNINSRRRRAKPAVGIVFVTIALVALLTALALTLKIVVFSPNAKFNGITDEIIDSTGESPVSPPSFPAPIDPAANKDDKEPSMVIIEVTERSLTSIEIKEGIEKDNLFLARSSAGFEEAEELAAIHGTHKRKLYEACDPCEYYKPIIFWTRQDIQRLLQNTQETLPYFGGNRNTITALLDLNRIDSSSQDIDLIYSNKTGFSREDGQYSWNREHVWPCDRGLRCRRGNPEFTDIHNMFPADKQIDVVRANRFFDEISDDCTNGDDCILLEDLIKYGGENDVFQPPEDVRGVVARVILYMDLRYTHLEATDKPNPNKNNQMAYLSTLLEWHEKYPPTTREIERNNRACSVWQGNRNPFVDFPALAGILHGDSSMSDVVDPFPYCKERTEDPSELPSPMETSIDESSGESSSIGGALLILVNGILLCLFLFV